MPVTNLHFTHVGPFEDITVEFDPKVNVFTGPNNSGKSTLLWVLGDVLVYPFTLPTKVLRSDQAQWSMDVSTASGAEHIQGTFPTSIEHTVPIYETLGFTCYVPAQRHSTNFKSSGPTVSRDADSQFEEYFEIFAEERVDLIKRVGLEAFRQAVRQDPVHEKYPELAKRSKLMMAGNNLVSDKAVKQRIIDLDYTSSRRNKPIIKTYLNQVGSLAAEITEDFPIQFVGVKEDKQGLYPAFRTHDGDLPLDVLSQGTQSIIQFLAHVLLRYAEYYDFPSDLRDKPGIAIIDEIDAHLHPTWQRRIIPTLTNHFPNLQIFCSTHSPLMLAGLRAEQVKLLRRDEYGKVVVATNESDISGWTGDEILRHFMEVSNPTDIATADRISRFEELGGKETLSDAQTEELEGLRQLVRADLLSGPMSAQVIKFAKELERARGEQNPRVLKGEGDGEGSGN